MKEQLLLRAARSCSVLCKLFVCVFLVNGSVAAAGNTQDTSVKAPQFNYVGQENDLLAFSINYPNPEGKTFLLEVKDENNEILYQHTFNSINFTKKIYLVNNRDKATVSFGIKADRSIFRETFKISPEVKIVEDLVVKRL